MSLLVSVLLTFAASAIASTHTKPDRRFIANAPSTDCEHLFVNEFDRTPDDTENGLITNSVPMTVPYLLEAYSRGIFPWGVSGPETGAWYNPPMRGILELEHIDIDDPETTIPRSDRKFLRKHLNSGEFEFTTDKAFPEVISGCALQRRWTIDRDTQQRVQASDWLTGLFVQRYTEFHRAGYAHSEEAWKNGKLVAGLYGVFVNGMYSGESMFHDPVDGSNAMKLVLYRLAKRLRANGHTFIDTQVIPELGLTEKWGGYYVPRDEYLKKLKAAQDRGLHY